MSQVKNLRAMFENKGDDPSPPDRGRSPGAPWPGTFAGTGVKFVRVLTIREGPTSSDSPRPLSKVRTSFVTIEKDGRMGLRRDPSHESSPSRRCPSTDVDPENLALEDAGRTPRKLFAKSSLAESPHAAIEPNTSTLPAETKRAVSNKPSLNPDKQIDEEKPAPSLTPVEPTATDSINDSKSAPLAPTTGGKTKMDSNRDVRGMLAKKSSSSRQLAASAKIAAKGPPKSGPASKISSGTTKRLDPGSNTKAQEKPTARREAGTTATASIPLSKPPSSTGGRKPVPVKPSREHDTGFVKPKPKSPTKPVRLPASLMAPTASSVSKGAGGRPTLSRQSGSLQPPNHTVRAPSRADVTAADNPTTKTVKRQASSINRPRPSLGPPPKKFAQDHPVPKKDTQVDESFLARMMRPTQASSSKTNEKAPTTPPRRSAVRPSTSNTDYSSRRASSVKRRPKPLSPTGNKLVLSGAGDTMPDSAEMASTITVMDSDEISIQSPQHGGLQSDQQQRNGAAPEVTAQVETAEEALDLAEETDLARTGAESMDTKTVVKEAPEIQTVILPKEEPGHIDEPQQDAMAKDPYEPQSPKPLPQADEAAEEGHLIDGAAASEEPIAEAQRCNSAVDIQAGQEDSSSMRGISAAEVNDGGKT
ncbi:hypothetical protein ACO1O0_003422 [Amphichorda felina]